MVISIKNNSPEQSAAATGAAAKRLRLQMNLSRAELAERAGVPAATLRRFEETGLAPFLTVIRIARTLSCDDQIDHLFDPPQTTPSSIEELMAEEPTQPRRRASPRR